MTKEKRTIHSVEDQGIWLVEEERKRIARDLHDGPAQALSILAMNMDITGRMIDVEPELAKRKLKQMNSRLIESVEEVRRLIHDLHPIVMEDIGIIQATEHLVRRFKENWELKAEMSVENEDRILSISPARQMMVYRIIQEIMNNIQKHAEASLVRLSFHTEFNWLTIVVSDDGRGFDPDLVYDGHYGMIGMKERTEYLKGTLDIQSTIGEGSSFTIRIPMK